MKILDKKSLGNDYLDNPSSLRRRCRLENFSYLKRYGCETLLVQVDIEDLKFLFSINCKTLRHEKTTC